MVIFPCCEKQRSWEATGTDVHTQPMVIELIRSGYVADVEVDVTDGAAERNSRPRSMPVTQELAKVQRLRGDGNLAVMPQPFFPIPVRVHLNLEAVWIFQVEASLTR